MSGRNEYGLTAKQDQFRLLGYEFLGTNRHGHAVFRDDSGARMWVDDMGRYWTAEAPRYHLDTPKPAQRQQRPADLADFTRLADLLDQTGPRDMARTREQLRGLSRDHAVSAHKRVMYGRFAALLDRLAH